MWLPLYAAFGCSADRSRYGHARRLGCVDLAQHGLHRSDSGSVTGIATTVGTGPGTRHLSGRPACQARRCAAHQRSGENRRRRGRRGWGDSEPDADRQEPACGGRRSRPRSRLMKGSSVTKRESVSPRRIGLWGVVSIGIGGMVGGGIFAVLGLSVQIAGGGAPVAFLVAGLVALLTARSYALLSTSFPSRGGTVTFVNRAFGPGLFTGGINVLLWLSYIVMLALYAQAFGSYAASFLPAAQHELGKHLFLTAAVVPVAVLNVAGASTVARAERYVVAIT